MDICKVHSLKDQSGTESINQQDIPGAEVVTVRVSRAVCRPASTKDCLLLSLKRDTLLLMTSDILSSHLCWLGDSQPSTGVHPSMMTWMLSETICSGDHDSMQSWVTPAHCLDERRKLVHTFSTILTPAYNQSMSQVTKCIIWTQQVDLTFHFWIRMISMVTDYV